MLGKYPWEFLALFLLNTDAVVSGHNVGYAMVFNWAVLELVLFYHSPSTICCVVRRLNFLWLIYECDRKSEKGLSNLIKCKIRI
jgi:hypothetical protein